MSWGTKWEPMELWKWVWHILTERDGGRRQGAGILDEIQQEPYGMRWFPETPTPPGFKWPTDRSYPPEYAHHIDR